MDFDIGRANVCRRFDLRFIRIDKQGDQDAGIRQALTGIAHLVALAGDVQPAFGGHFLTLLRHRAAEVRFGFAGDRQHLFGDRHFKIHAGVQRLAQDTHIAIGNMATVFAQMHGNAVGAGLFGNESRLNRIG